MDHPSPAQRDILWNALTALAIISLLGVMALVIFAFISFLSWSYPILLPIGLAILVSLFLEPAVSFFYKRGLSRIYATLVVFLLALITLAAFLAFCFPLISDVINFVSKLPGTISDGLGRVNGFLDDQSPVKDWLVKNQETLQTQISQKISTFLSSILAPLGSAFSFIFGFAFVPIYVFYFLTDKETIADRWKEYIPLRRAWWRDETIGTLSEINDSLVKYLRGQIVVALVNGILTSIGLSLVIGIPHGLVLGIMAGALSIVPFLGIIVSIVPAIIIAAFITGPMHIFGEDIYWLRPLLVLVIFALVQMVESVFVTPRVQSHSTGLHPLAIIIGIIFWSMVLPGLLGPVLAVPLTSAVVVIFRRYVWQVKSEKDALPVSPASQEVAA